MPLRGPAPPPRPCPAAAVQPEELAAVGAEFDRAGRHGIVGVDPGEQLPSAVRAALQIFDVAIVGHATDGVAHPEPRIGEKPCEALVELQQSAFAGRDIHPIDVEVMLVALVVRDQQFARENDAKSAERSMSPRVPGQRHDIAGLEIDTPGAPVLVAALVAEEHDMPVIVHPDDPGADVAVGHRSHGAPCDVVDRGDPKIEHAVDRRTEGDPCAVPTDAHDASLEISEDQAAREAAPGLSSSTGHGGFLVGVVAVCPKVRDNVRLLGQGSHPSSPTAPAFGGGTPCR